jgi:hypothetical protein
MAWWTNEQPWHFGAYAFDGLERRFEPERPELLGVVVGGQPVADVASQIIERGIVEGVDGGILDRADHSLGLTVGPRVIWLCQPVLDAVLGADGAEYVCHEAAFRLPVVLDELHAVVGQHGVDLIGNGPDQGLEEACGDELRCFPMNPGEDELRGPIHRDEEVGLPTLVMQLSNVDMEVANLIYALNRLGFSRSAFGRREMPLR